MSGVTGCLSCEPSGVCSVSGRPQHSPPPRHLQWMLGDTLLENETKSKLVIPSATVEDCIGRFVCVARNEYGEVKSAPAFVEYTPAPPVIDVDLPDRMQVLLGDEVTLEVHATGLPPPEYAWYFNGDKVTAQEAGNRLTITSVTQRHCGVYQCVLYNNNNSSKNVTRSKRCEVSLQSAPVVVAEPRPVPPVLFSRPPKVTVGSDFVFLQPVKIAVEGELAVSYRLSGFVFVSYFAVIPSFWIPCASTVPMA